MAAGFRSRRPRSASLMCGFVQGVTVAEQLRTFGGKLFRLDLHLARLARSLEIVGVDPGLPLAELGPDRRGAGRAESQAARSGRRFGRHDFCHAGHVASLCGGGQAPGADRLRSHAAAAVRALGREISHGRIAGRHRRDAGSRRSAGPPELKCRSRMHYYLADKQAREIEPGARALLLDERGFVTEASTANILVYFTERRSDFAAEGAHSARRDRRGRRRAGRAARHSVCSPRADGGGCRRADEVLLCSTSPCVWSVTRLNGQPIARWQAGPICSAAARRLEPDGGARYRGPGAAICESLIASPVPGPVWPGYWSCSEACVSNETTTSTTNPSGIVTIPGWLKGTSACSGGRP